MKKSLKHKIYDKDKLIIAIYVPIGEYWCTSELEKYINHVLDFGTEMFDESINPIIIPIVDDELKKAMITVVNPRNLTMEQSNRMDRVIGALENKLSDYLQDCNKEEQKVYEASYGEIDIDDDDEDYSESELLLKPEIENKDYDRKIDPYKFEVSEYRNWYDD